MTKIQKINFGNTLILKKEGYPTKEAYKLANIKKSLEYLTLDQWNEGGYYVLLRKKCGGRKTKLTTNQLKELKTYIISNKQLSESDVQKFIKNKWDKEYSIPGIKNLLKTQFNIKLDENE